jgi:hypothetical protein
LKAKQPGVLTLYGKENLSCEEMTNLSNCIGNLISINGYLSLHSQRSVVYDLATKMSKVDGFQRVFFEYKFDLNIIEKIFLANVREYSTYPQQADFLVDIGKKMCFLIKYISFMFFYRCNISN